jgi:malate dehydrogenase (oxaloacetate-decarboxylating)(NADP+)
MHFPDHAFFVFRLQAGTGIADLIALSISRDGKKSVEDARKQIYLVDSKVGLTNHTSQPLKLTTQANHSSSTR